MRRVWHTKLELYRRLNKLTTPNLATRLVHEGFVVSVINPAQAHHFAKALLKRAKTDTIDAQTLAQLATVLQPEPWTLPPPIYYALQQRLAQRDDLLNLRQ